MIWPVLEESVYNQKFWLTTFGRITAINRPAPYGESVIFPFYFSCDVPALYWIPYKAFKDVLFETFQSFKRTLKVFITEIFRISLFARTLQEPLQLSVNKFPLT